MTSLPSNQAMLNGDDQAALQTPPFSFPSSTFRISQNSNFSNLLPTPIARKSLDQQSYMNDPLYPLYPSMRAGLSSTTVQSQGGFWASGTSTSFLSQALQNMDSIPPQTDVSMRNTTNPVMLSSDRIIPGVIPPPPRQTLLQEQQRELRERMEHLTSLLNSSNTKAQSEELSNKRPLKWPPSAIEVDFSVDEMFDQVEPQPPTKRQRVVSSSPTNEKRFRTYQADQWNEKFSDLVSFQKKHGHCCVPHIYAEEPTLARWVKRQRYQYKLFVEGKAGSTMTEERMNMLANLGFCWDRHSEAWEIRFSELRSFLEQNGHTNVPSNYKNAQLATWIKCQRRQYKMRWEKDSAHKKTLLSDERIGRLEALSFEWELRSRPRNS